MKPKPTISDIETRVRQLAKERGWSEAQIASVILLVMVLRGGK